jgi:predicted metal-dependent hydrolase
MMPPESSAVQFGGTRIDYTVRRSARRRTVAVAVDPRLGVLVAAPDATPLSRLDAVVHRKARWIVERLRRVRRTEQPLPQREFVSGESYLYLGRHYRLKVVPVAQPGDARVAGGLLVVGVHRALRGAERTAAARRAVESWYRRRAARRLAQRVRQWAPTVGVAEPHVVIRSQQRRWASCDAHGTLRINWRIVQAPMRLVDYVVAHELVHLRHQEHSKAFWAALGRAMPDYERRAEDLRRIGARLAW